MHKRAVEATRKGGQSKAPDQTTWFTSTCREQCCGWVVGGNGRQAALTQSGCCGLRSINYRCR